MTLYQPDAELVSAGGVRAARTEGARALLATLEQPDRDLSELATLHGLALSVDELARIDRLRRAIERERNPSADGT